MELKDDSMKRIAIFASGNGSNAQNIIEYFADIQDVEISLILSNNLKSHVLKRAHNFHIPTVVFTRKELYETEKVLEILNGVDYIILAGFLWLIPENIIKKYNKKIINIHPALLPKYGGKGMYGNKVHESVINNNEKESGITIHYVNEEYDDGDIIFQSKCLVEPGDTPDILATKIHELEYKYFPKIIKNLIFGFKI